MLLLTNWLGLMIGNSRLHWAWLEDNQVRRTWNTPHIEPMSMTAAPASLLPPFSFPPDLDSPSPNPPLIIASVVPSQTLFWQQYPNAVELTLNHVPLHNLYPTMGLDRALAALGAFHHWQCPVLVIDGGTALTFTGVDGGGAVTGGAIAPGLALQLRSLHLKTAALPEATIAKFADTEQLERWQSNTTDAIRSGVWYCLLAGVKSFIDDWFNQFPQGKVVFTGGDGKILHQSALGQLDLGQKQLLHYDAAVAFRGMAIASSSLRQ